jgi:hypothetical protein
MFISIPCEGPWDLMERDIMAKYAMKTKSKTKKSKKAGSRKRSRG